MFLEVRPLLHEMSTMAPAGSDTCLASEHLVRSLSPIPEGTVDTNMLCLRWVAQMSGEILPFLELGGRDGAVASKPETKPCAINLQS